MDYSCVVVVLRVFVVRCKFRLMFQVKAGANSAWKERRGDKNKTLRAKENHSLFTPIDTLGQITPRRKVAD